MTNIEFFKDDLLKMVETRNKIAIVKGKPTNCRYVKRCANCDRLYSCNDTELVKWLLSEHYDSESDYVLTFDSGTTSWTTDEKHNIVHWKYVKFPEEEGEQNDN